MECSFYIWLHRNTKDWAVNSASFAECRKDDFETTIPSCNQKQKVPKNKASSVSKQTACSSKHTGFINKGNTCYINSILQALSTLPSFWCQNSSQSGTISPSARALSLNLSLVKKRSSPVDPSNFIRAFQENVGHLSTLTPNRMFQKC